MLRFYQKFVATICLISVSVSMVVLPLPARAQGMPVIDLANLSQSFSKEVLDKVYKTLGQAAMVGVKNALTAFLGKLAYDAAVWTASAGTGQQSLVYSQPVGEYFADAGDAAAGGAIEGFATTAGLDAAGLCNPGDDFRINLTIGLDTNIAGGTGVYKPACTLTELTGNWQEAYSDPNFDKYFALQFDSTANPLGISLEAENMTVQIRDSAIENAKQERLTHSEGFADVTEQVSGAVLTPGSLVKKQLDNAQEGAQKNALEMVGDPVVDALNIFASTLISKLTERVQNGIANLQSGDELSGLLGGEFSGTSRGRAAAEARYAELRQPVFASSGSFDVLSEFAACPDEPDLRTVTNCTIGAALQTAIQENWTVQEFVDYQASIGQNFSFANDSITTSQIQNSEGTNRTAIAVMKKFRIVPVGWQVAADYIASSTDTPNLKQLTDCYNYCGSADTERSCDFLLTDSAGDTTNYSPYCGLVDPYWVLSAPQNFCEREAPGSVLADQRNYDTDANVNTQEALIVNRLNYCADTRGCIQEEQDGVCTAYGYCTEEKRIYRFAGDICDPEYSSCETFTDEDGNDVSYVKSTLNYNDCATDPGCQWYCLTKDAGGNYNCASPTETYVSCSEDVTTNESDYGLSVAVDYDANEACSCSTTQTCEVPAGSDTGDSNGDGLIDYRQCAVSNTDGSQSICTISDNCGASNSSYDAATTTCTCTITNSGTVASGETSVDLAVDTIDGSSAVNTCTLSEACSSSSSTYSNAPVCSIASGSDMNCGDTCTSTTGGSCVNSLGNTCTDGSDTDLDATDGKCLLSDACDISTGAATCTSDNGNLCILGTEAEVPAESNTTLYFDNNVEECSSSDAGCNQYIRSKPDTNLIPNALFDYYDETRNTIDDTVGDDLAFCTDTGSGCASDSECHSGAAGSCVGWTQSGTTAYVLDSSYDGVVSSELGSNYIQLEPAATGTIDTIVDTGHSLANRTFTLAYQGMSSDGSCTGVSYTIGSSDGVDVSTAGTNDEYTTDWQDFTTTYTFSDSTTDTAIHVAIASNETCAVDVAGVSLTEAFEFSGDYANYATNNVTYLNGDTLECDPSDVGCELYVEDGLSDEEGIPGIITNPASSSCVDSDGNYNYDDPSCSQCNGDPAADQADDYYAGCDFYQEVALANTIPVVTDESWLTSAERDGVMKRSGKYCSGDSTLHCLADSDCPASSACIEQVSIVPSSGDSCSASAVGCEAYTNLAEIEAGGEGIEYYSELKQCVKTDDTNTAVFYTLEGSDSSGVTVEDHALKVDQASSDGRPCINLDPESEDYNADCADSDYSDAVQSTWDCGPAGDIDGDGTNNTDDTTTDDNEYGTDPNCRQYTNSTGTVFYRFESDVIVASDDCTPIRNSLDNRVYYALTSESNSCNESEVSCREYKGSDSGSAEDVIAADFSDNSTTDWEGATTTSNESVLEGGYSLQLESSTISYALFTQEDTDDDGTDETYGLLDDGLSYVLTFWAKTTEGGSVTASISLSGTSGSDYSFDAITLDPAGAGGWQQYKVGPIILPVGTNVDDGDEYFNLIFTGSTSTSQAYIDNIKLTSSSSQYLIQDSSRTCDNFEGCRAYQDRADNTYYLKSFLRLCGDSAVGCEAMIATQNSSNPFTEAYNLDNEYDQDDVIVQNDQPVTLVYNEDNICIASAMGCSEVGLPNVDDRTGVVIDYTSAYLLNRPDDYNSILCEQPQLSCRRYTSGFDGTVYFKDPGEKLCDLQQYSVDGNTFNGWFKADSTSTTPDCPVQHDFSGTDIHYASQPLGGVCNSNSVHHASDGTGDVLDEKVGALCNQDADCYPDDWSDSVDAQPRCISNLDDDVDVFDGSTHQYTDYPDDGYTLASLVSDFGWVGVCPGDQSGCSEYIDSYSPNLTEMNDNWSFEDDVRDDNNTYYATDATKTGFPDYWMIPDFDLEGDGTADFDSSCTTTNAVITAFSADTVNPADGSSALKLTGPCAIEQKTFSLDVALNKTYTIQAQVKMDKTLLNGADASITPAEFSVGIHFYDSDSNLITGDSETIYPVADHATIATEDGTDTDGLSYWYRFQGSFGLGTTVSIPSNAKFARVFMANHTANSIYFDAVSLKEADKYYYINKTVDGTAQREQVDGVNTCIDQDTSEASITSDGGCVAFRDTTSDTQNYSQDGLDCTSCLLTPNADSCRYLADACDSNTVLKVKKDRVCGEWLSCETASVTTSTNGATVSQCFAIDRCTELDEEGNCSSPIPDPAYAELSADSDLHFTSANGDVNQLSGMRNLAGYSKVGVTWDDVLYCSGGPNDGLRCQADQDCIAVRCEGMVPDVSSGTLSGTCSNKPKITCSADSDCYEEGDVGTCSVPYSTDGYYPYGWMTEVGSSGAQAGNDLIELNDFENLYCAGNLGDPTVPCVLNATSETDPGHCYTNTLKQKVDGDTTGETTVGDVVYIDDGGTQNTDLAFCPNSPKFGDFWPYGDGGGNSFTQDGWQPVGDSDVFITQYQNYQDCPAPCNDIDLNNVLQIGSTAAEGSDTFSSGGVTYDLQDNIYNGGTYSLSFDARYVDSSFKTKDSGGTPSTVRICLKHNNIGDSAGNELDRKDCFVNGLGMVDIVFAIDTSYSMGDEITAVKEAVPALAEDLSNAGIDARFALIDMDDNDDTSKESAIQEGNHIDLDFTSDITKFTEAVSNMNDESSSVDPFNAIYETITNSFYGSETLTYRSEADRFLVVVTDAIDEIGDNGVDSDLAYSTAIGANFPVFVATAESNMSNYTALTEATGGATYSYEKSDGSGVTETDWATNTTIISDIMSKVLNTLDVFQFNTELQTYTLGPITIEQKTVDTGAGEQIINSGITTDLEFVGSDGAPYQLDNVSLLPVLEVSKEIDPVARSCRAYPETDSLQCNYSETSGTVYKGWKGYCIETDPLNTNRCVTWWPIDILAGETSIVERQASGYSGRSGVYHCLISKGLVTPGFCDATDFSSTDPISFGDDVICSDDSTCSALSGSCINEATYYFSDVASADATEHDDLTQKYSETTTTLASGSCTVKTDSDNICWPDEGYCLNYDTNTVVTGYTNSYDCVTGGDTNNWETIGDPMHDGAVLATGDCVDISGGHYSEYSDPRESELTATSYCFYDQDGATGAELRTTRSCSADSDCQAEPTATDPIYCASLACIGGIDNGSCGYHSNEGNSECQLDLSAMSEKPYTTTPLSWQMPDPYEGTGQINSGVIVRLPANEILRNINASEIQAIDFYPGSAGEGGGAGDESWYWGQQPTIFDDSTGTTTSVGHVWLTDLKNGVIQFNSDGTRISDSDNNNCYIHSEGVVAGVGCRMWGLYDNKNLSLENYAALQDSSDRANGLDLVYTWVWGNFDDNAATESGDCVSKTSADGDTKRSFGNMVSTGTINDWFDSGCIDEGFKALAGGSNYNNVWANIKSSSPDLWAKFYKSDVTTEDTDNNITTEDTDVVSFTSSEVSGAIWPVYNGAYSSTGGGNILSLYVDFNDEGYIQAVYVLEYFAAVATQDSPFLGHEYGVETTYSDRMNLTLQTRESCALITESVGSDGSNTAWAVRSGQVGYDINHDGTNPYGHDETAIPFGSITPQNSNPTQWDFFSTESDYQWETFGAQPAVAMETESSSGHPLACLGDCSITSCIGDPQTIGSENCDASSCDNGVCMGVGDATISKDGQNSTSYENLDEQLLGTVSSARDRLKHVFANIDSFYKLTFTNDTSSVYVESSASNSTQPYWDDATVGNIFTTMSACNGDGSARPDALSEDAEYCGVYPTVTGITLNDKLGLTTSGGYLSVNNGQTVKLQFTSTVDSEQKPLKMIFIDWGDGSVPTLENWNAEPTTHIYTHAYVCSPDNGNRFKDNDHCEFTPKISLVDGWNWCSGTTVGECSNPAYTTKEACKDAKETDEDPTASWSTTLTETENRYEDSSTNVISSCKSYDEPNLTIKVDATN